MTGRLPATAILCVLLASNLSAGQKEGPENPEPMSGLFAAGGFRLDTSHSAQNETKEELKEQYKRIDQWANQAVNARSASMRVSAANAIGMIAQLHGTSNQKLSAGEIVECRKGALALLKSQDLMCRARAASALEFVGDKSCCSALLAALKGGDDGVRMAVSDALAVFGNDTCVPALIAISAKDAGEVRYTSLRALSRIGTPAARKALEDLAKKARNAKTRELTLEAIDYIDGHRK